MTRIILNLRLIEFTCFGEPIDMKSNYSNVGLLEGMLYSDSMVAFAGQYRPPTSGCQTQRVGFHRGLSRRLAAAGRISVN